MTVTVAVAGSVTGSVTANETETVTVSVTGSVMALVALPPLPDALGAVWFSWCLRRGK